MSTNSWAVSAGCLPQNVASFASLSLRRTAADAVTAEIALYDRDRVARDRSAAPAVAARYALGLAGGGVVEL